MALYIYKWIVALIFSTSLVAFADEGWVTVPRQEQVVHQLENEDRSIWVVFAKTFGSERVLVRFPEDPVYRHDEGRFEAFASHLGRGEMSLSVRKKNLAASFLPMSAHEIVYRDSETGQWVFEKHIETSQHQYVLRFSHPSQSRVLFRQFADSFEIEPINP